MTHDRVHVRLASYLVLMSAGEVLLMRRAGTGWGDGRYSLPAGHVDPGETASQAIVREAREEVGVDVDPAGLRLVHVMHRQDDTDYIDFYFAAERWTGGQPRIVEPHKADDLRWCSLGALPAELLDTVAQALGAVAADRVYSEHGW